MPQLRRQPAERRFLDAYTKRFYGGGEMPDKLVMCWSSGKDCALALHLLVQSQEFEIVSLLSVVTEGFERVSMHGVRRGLLQAQAESIGLPVCQVMIPQDCPFQVYEERMGLAVANLASTGVSAFAFGDIHLDGVRRYREEKLAKVNMTALFPLWGRRSQELARTFLDAGFKAIVACVDTQALDASFAGRDYDDAFLQDLPAGVDVCGENGEFHTFVHDEPIFSTPVAVRTAEKVDRGRFSFCELLPGEVRPVR